MDHQRVLDFLKLHDRRNTVVITGDKHQHSVRTVPEDYRDVAGPPIATEFVGASISSAERSRAGWWTTGSRAHSRPLLLRRSDRVDRAGTRVYAAQRKPVAAGRGASGLAGRPPSGSSSL